MSFLRNEEIYRSDMAKRLGGNDSAAPQHSSAAMSFQPAIPRQVALQQSPPPLRRLATIVRKGKRRARIFHPTATTPLTLCLTIGVHFKSPLCFGPRLSLSGTDQLRYRPGVGRC